MLLPCLESCKPERLAAAIRLRESVFPRLSRLPCDDCRELLTVPADQFRRPEKDFRPPARGKSRHRPRTFQGGYDRTVHVAVGRLRNNAYDRSVVGIDDV